MRSIGKCLAGLVVAAGLVGSPALAAAKASEGKAHLGLIKIEGALAEHPGPFDWLDTDPDSFTLRELITGLAGVASSEELEGVVLQLKDAELTTAQVEEIGSAIRHAREKGKKVHILSDSYGTPELILASYADEAICQSGGGVMLAGMHMEEMFLADTLSWIGLKADMVQVGDYKGANEQYTRTAPSPQWDENITQLLDGLYGNMRTHIKEGRKIDDARLDQAMRSLWLADAEEAVKAGVLDSAIDMPKLGDHLKQAYGQSISWKSGLIKRESAKSMDMSNPFAMLSMLQKKPDHSPKGPTIAVLSIDGVIVDGESQDGGMFGSGKNVGSRTIRNAIEDILAEDQIKGVVVRVNSPGGSAIASEVMWQGIQRLRDKKKVWVSVGGMAASGGYYVSVAGEKIYVNPSSIVGSIGVVGGKFSMQGLYDLLKVKVTTRSRGPAGEMFRSTTPWSDAELAEVKRKMTKTYDQFTSRVTQGRNGIDLKKTAEGRLFTGQKAIALKMADKVGGLDDAIRDMAQDLALDDYGVMHYPGPKSFQEALEDAFKQFVKAPNVAGRSAAGAGRVPGLAGELVDTLRVVVGERAWPSVEQGLSGMMLMRQEPVLMIHPSVIIVK